MKTTFVQAVCCEVSTKPGAANTTSFHGHLPERVKCATCGKEYSIDDNPADLNRIVDFANKLVVAARRAVNESHRLLGELHDLEIDRTSCASFWANQLRVLLTAAAYVLMQELRLRAAGTACARAQVLTLRERLLKLGARVMGPVRRFVIHLPASFPFLLASVLLPAVWVLRADKPPTSCKSETKLVTLLAKVRQHLSNPTFEPH